MRQNNVKTLPVVDEENRLHGLITLSDLANKFFGTIDTNVIGRGNTSLSNIVDTLNGRILCGEPDYLVESGKLVIVAMQIADMSPFIEAGDVVIVGNRVEAQMQAIELKVSCLIVTTNSVVSDEVLATAQENKVIVISCPSDTFTTSRLISQSVSVSYVMTTEKLTAFYLDDFIGEIKAKMLQTRYRSYPVLDDYNVIQGFISRFHLIASRKKKVILVDHNEKAQSVDGIEEAEILEIIDHHRVGDMQTAYPISVILEPVGSTATIIANIFFDNAIRPSKSIAGILCGAIISDTMNFKSPTSVYKDKITAEKLAEIAGINIVKFAEDMIRESSSFHGKTVKEIWNEDFKEFVLGNQKLAISQIKTMDTNCINEILEDLLRYMHQLRETGNYQLVMFCITDIIREGSEIIAIGESVPILEKAFNITLKNNQAFLPGVVSRKKQILPLLANLV
jgi:manganese-dependent inorganic pyrophosphatase